MGLTLNGDIVGSGTLTCTQRSVWLALGGDNDGFQGTFSQSGSATQTHLKNANAGSKNATWQIDGGSLANDVEGNVTIDLGALCGTSGALYNNSQSGSVTFSVGGKNQSTEFDGVIEEVVGFGAVALTKVGADRLTLGGANTYTGTTIVRAGEVVLDGSSAWSPLLANGVDIRGGKVVFQYAGGADPASTIHGLLGTTIYSSTVSFGHALGWIDETANHRVIVAYTWQGDANCDGAVNSVDMYPLILNWLTQSGATWSMGDFNSDGAVNVVDFTILMSYMGQGTTVPLHWAPQSGSTAWDLTTPNWIDGDGDTVCWSNGNLAQFDGTPTTVTISDAIVANSIEFDVSGSTLR